MFISFLFSFYFHGKRCIPRQMSFTPITRATLNSTLANSSQCPSPWYTKLRMLWKLVGNRKNMPGVVILGIAFLRQHSKVMTENTVWKNLCNLPGFGFWRSLRLLCLISLILLKLLSKKKKRNKIFVDSSKLGFNVTVTWEYSKTNSKYPFISFIPRNWEMRC